MTTLPLGFLKQGAYDLAFSDLQEENADQQRSAIEDLGSEDYQPYGGLQDALDVARQVFGAWNGWQDAVNSELENPHAPSPEWGGQFQGPPTPDQQAQQQFGREQRYGQAAAGIPVPAQTEADIGAGQSGDVFDIPGQATRNALSDVGAPDWIKGPAGNIADFLPFAAFGPGSLAARTGGAALGGLGNYYGTELGQEAGLPDLPVVGNPGGFAGMLAAPYLGFKGAGVVADRTAPVPELSGYGYHWTPDANVDPIMSQGLNQGSWLADSPEKAAALARIPNRISTNLGFGEVSPGQVLRFPIDEGMTTPSRTTLTREPAWRTNQPLEGGEIVPREVGAPAREAFGRLATEEGGGLRLHGGLQGSVPYRDVYDVETAHPGFSYAGEGMKLNPDTLGVRELTAGKTPREQGINAVRKQMMRYIDQYDAPQAIDVIGQDYARTPYPRTATAKGEFDEMQRIHERALADPYQHLAEPATPSVEPSAAPARPEPQTDLFGTEVYRSPGGENVPNETQAGLGIASGERPVETAGPMFNQPEPPLSDLERKLQASLGGQPVTPSAPREIPAGTPGAAAYRNRPPAAEPSPLVPPQADLTPEEQAAVTQFGKDVPDLVDPERYAVSQYWAKDMPNPTNPNLSQMRTGLYNAGIDSLGTSAEVRARYSAAEGRGVKLPQAEPPSGPPDATDYAARDMPQRQAAASGNPPAFDEAGRPLSSVEAIDLHPVTPEAAQQSAEAMTAHVYDALGVKQDALTNAIADAEGSQMPPGKPPTGTGEGGRPFNFSGNAPDIVQKWVADQKTIMASQRSAPGILGRIDQSLRSAIGGTVHDSYTSQLLDARDNLTNALIANGVDPRLAETVGNLGQEVMLQERFGGKVPMDVGKDLANIEMARRTPDKTLGALNRMNQEVKNGVFGLDFGIFGQSLLESIESGGMQALAGLANRTLGLLHMPGFMDVYANVHGLNAETIRLLAGDVRDVNVYGIANSKRIGTLLGEIPGLRIADQKLIAPAIEKFNNLQFGTIMGVPRKLIYEGNLRMAALRGADIADAVVQKQAMDNARNITSVSRLAQTPTRANLERFGETAPGFTRSQFNRVLDISQLVRPGATAMQRQMAATQLVSMGTSLVALKAISDAVSSTPWEWDPNKPGFGTITVGGRTISLLPQASLSKTLVRSAENLWHGKPAELAKDWEKFGVGRGSVTTQAVAAQAGAGFNEQTGHFSPGFSGDSYKGNLKSFGERFLPLGVGNQLQERAGGHGFSPLGTGLNEIGVQNYPEYQPKGSGWDAIDLNKHKKASNTKGDWNKVDLNSHKIKVR